MEEAPVDAMPAFNAVTVRMARATVGCRSDLILTGGCVERPLLGRVDFRPRRSTLLQNRSRFRCIPTLRQQEQVMRFMVMVKATPESEAGNMPSQELLAAMTKYNEELVRAGVMLAGEGLHPSSKGARVHFDGASRKVVDGPFTETKELVAGFWLWQCKSMEEAIEWVKRCPNPMEGPSDIEIRQIFEAADFGAEFTPELQQRNDRLRGQLEAR
jgi:hypothetical protein